jgi:hypothetical protein
MDKLELAKKRLEIKRNRKAVVAEDLASKIGSAYAARDIQKLNQTVEGVLDGIGEKLEAAIAELPKPDAPVVNVETDTTELEKIADKTATEIEALQRKLDPKPSLDTLLAVKSEISGLKSVFEGISKAVQQDIYARYDFSDSATENGVQYIGYLNQYGDWFIQRIGAALQGDSSSTYAVGARGKYATNWQKRTKLIYSRRDEVVIP